MKTFNTILGGIASMMIVACVQTSDMDQNDLVEVDSNAVETCAVFGKNTAELEENVTWLRSDSFEKDVWSNTTSAYTLWQAQFEKVLELEEKNLNDLYYNDVVDVYTFETPSEVKYDMVTYYPGDNEYGAIFVAGTLDVVAHIGDGDIEGCVLPEEKEPQCIFEGIDRIDWAYSNPSLEWVSSKHMCETAWEEEDCFLPNEMEEAQIVAATHTDNLSDAFASVGRIQKMALTYWQNDFANAYEAYVIEEYNSDLYVFFAAGTTVVVAELWDGEFEMCTEIKGEELYWE